MYIQRLAKYLVQKAFFVFEIFSFEVDAYMYIQKTVFFLPCGGPAVVLVSGAKPVDGGDWRYNVTEKIPLGKRVP